MTKYGKWLSKLRARQALLLAARAAHSRNPTPVSRAKVALRRAQVAQAMRGVARTRPRMDTIIGIDGVPLPRGLVLALRDARAHGWSGKVVSGDRRKGVAEKYGKRSQAALWEGWRARRPGFNPANPPGFSSHERRSDGSVSLRALGRAYRKSGGSLLSWWQTGIDVTESVELVRVLGRLGYSVARPYNSPREAHHVNFKSNPTARLTSRGRV